MFDAYASAALIAQAEAPQYITRVFFTPDRRRAAIEKTAAAQRLVERGAFMGGEFHFSPTPVFEDHPYHAGWRLIGRTLVWRIEDALKTRDDSKAVQLTIIATRFGFDLCGGGATDASLGMAIVDEARRAIAPALERMQSSDLLALSSGIREALERKPELAETLANERQNMLMGVQAVQDAYRDKDLDKLSDELGIDVQSGVDYLRSMSRSDGPKRSAYFQAFAAEASLMSAQFEVAANLPAQKRGEYDDEPKGERPWRKFAKQFFRTAPPLLDLHDATIARSRLLVLEAGLLAQVKRLRRAPKDLSAYAQEICQDPYTGKPFIYRSNGAEYRVYSVGSNYQDDGGVTDESYTAPDLKLERRIGS